MKRIDTVIVLTLWLLLCVPVGYSWLKRERRKEPR